MSSWQSESEKDFLPHSAPQWVQLSKRFDATRQDPVPHRTISLQKKVAPQRASDFDRPRNIVRRISAAKLLPSQAASDRQLRIAQAIAQLTDEHMALMLTLRNRQRRARKARQQEKKLLVYQQAKEDASRSVDGLASLLSILETSTSKAPDSDLQRLPHLVSRDAEESGFRVRRISSKPHNELTTDVDRADEATRQTEKETAHLTEQYNKYASPVPQRMAGGARIRTVPTKKPLISKNVKGLKSRSFDLEQARARLFDKDIARLDAQCKMIMFTLKQRKREQMTQWRPVPLENESEEQRRNPPNLHDRIRRAYHATRRVYQILRADVRDIDKSIQERRTKILQRRKAAIKKVMKREMPSLNQWAQLSRATNDSAVEIYHLHNLLRLRIGKMIFYRQKERKQVLGIRSLENYLLQLRAFDGVLFYNKPDTTPEHIRARLRDLELRSVIQRSLVLNTAQGMQLRRRRLFAQQRATAERKAQNNQDGSTTRIDTRSRSHGRTVQLSDKPPRSRKARETIRKYKTGFIQTYAKPFLRLRKFAAFPSERAVRRRRRRKSRLKTEFIDTVGSWLGGGEARSAQTSRAGRVFGARPLGSEADEGS